MTIETKTQDVPQQVIVALCCNRCHARVEADDVMAFQDAFSTVIDGGYASVWGDGTRVRIDLCAPCAKIVLGPFAQEIDT